MDEFKNKNKPNYPGVGKFDNTRANETKDKLTQKDYEGVVYEPSFKRAGDIDTHASDTRNRDTGIGDTRASDTRFGDTRIGGRRTSDTRVNDTRVNSARGDMRANSRVSANGINHRRVGNSKSAAASRAATRADSERRKKKDTQFAVFYIMVLFVAVVICIVIFAIAFSSTNTGSKVVASKEVPTAIPHEEVGIKEISQLTGQICEIDKSSQKIRLLDINTGRKFNTYVDGSTEMKDKYGKAVVLAEFELGDIVESNFDVKNGKLNNITISSQAWELKMVKDVKIDSENLIITYGNDNYMYDENLLVFYQGKPYDIKGIKPIDVVSIIGYKDKAWSINVGKSHGSMSFANYEKVNNGTIEVDTKVYIALQDSQGQKETLEPVTLLEGVHKLVVKGSNIETYTQDITIESGKMEVFDLRDIKLKTGLLNLTVNEPDYRLTIDGFDFPPGEAIVLEYGEHVVLLEKSDFVSVEQKIFIYSAYNELTLNFEKQIVLGKIVIETIPEGAEIYIDNAKIGNSPVEENLEYGEYTVFVRLDGYKSISIPVTINKSENPYLISLQKVEPTPLPVYQTPQPTPYVPPATPQPTPYTPPTSPPTPTPAQTDSWFIQEPIVP